MSDRGGSSRKRNYPKGKKDGTATPAVEPEVDVATDKDNNGKWPGSKLRTGWEHWDDTNEAYDNDITHNSGFYNTGRHRTATAEQVGLRRRIREWRKTKFEHHLFDMQIVPKGMHALPPTKTSYFVRFKILPEEGEAEERIFEFTLIEAPYDFEIYDATPGKPRLHIYDVLASLPQPDLTRETPERLSKLQADWYAANSGEKTHLLELRLNSQPKPRADWLFPRRQQTHLSDAKQQSRLQAGLEAHRVRKSRFRELPLELRNKIYSHVFPPIIEPKPLNSKHRGPWKLDPLNASLLLVSKACYQECSDHLFTSHSFRLDFPTLFRYLAGYGFETKRKFDSRRAVLHKIKHLELAFDYDAFMLFFGVKFPDPKLQYLQRKGKAWGNLQANLLQDLPFVDLTLTFDDLNRTHRTDTVEAVDNIIDHAIPFLRGRQAFVRGGVSDDQRARFESAINSKRLADFVSDETQSLRDAWSDDARCGGNDITSTTSWAAEDKDDPEDKSRSRSANEIMFGTDSGTQDAWAGVGGWSDPDLDTTDTWAMGGHMDLDGVIW